MKHRVDTLDRAIQMVEASGNAPGTYLEYLVEGHEDPLAAMFELASAFTGDGETVLLVRRDLQNRIVAGVQGPDFRSDFGPITDRELMHALLETEPSVVCSTETWSIHGKLEHLAKQTCVEGKNYIQVVPAQAGVTRAADRKLHRIN